MQHFPPGQSVLAKIKLHIPTIHKPAHIEKEALLKLLPFPPTTPLYQKYKESYSK